MSKPESAMIVLDIRLPFRNAEDLKARPDEKEEFLSRVREAQKDPKADGVLARLLSHHAADAIWIQAYHQDPDKPFVHAKPHMQKSLDFGSAGAGPDREPDHRSGKSDELVITAHFPKTDKPRSDEELARSTTHLVNNFEALGWMHEHCRARGYRSINARGQEYGDFASVRHNSIELVVAVVTFICPIVGVFLYVVKQPTIRDFDPKVSYGRTTVHIYGGNYDTFANKGRVSFNGHDVNWTWVSGSELTTDLSTPNSDPRVINQEISQITVANSIGSITSEASFALYPPQPTITDFLPKSATAGTLVDISGTNFLTAGLDVTFNGIQGGNIQLLNDRQITATVPAGSGVGPIRIVTVGGAVRSTTDFTEI